MAKAGYVQLRRGLFEHVKDGRLSFFEASLYVAIISDANPATGVCYGSAGLYAALFGLSPKTCRSGLEGLEKKGYLRRFTTPGKHGSYAIVIHKFLCSDGARKGMYVNALDTKDASLVAYMQGEDKGEETGEHDGEDKGELNAASKRREKRDEKPETKTIARSVPPEQLAGTLPLVDGSEFPISKSQIAEWVTAFPGVDVKTQLKQAKAWLEANPTRKKTRRGVMRFAVNWLDRAQNNGGSNGNQKRNSGNGGDAGGEDGPDLYAALYGTAEQGKPV